MSTSLGGKFKYHSDSGAFEYKPSSEVRSLIRIQDENKSLKEQNAQLTEKLDELISKLNDKGIIE